MPSPSPPACLLHAFAYINRLTDARHDATPHNQPAGIYAGTLVLCIGAYAYDKRKKARRAATNSLLKEEQQALTGVGGAPGTYGTLMEYGYWVDGFRSVNG